jgi:hypothetical protein
LVMFIVHIVIKVENNGNCNSAVHWIFSIFCNIFQTVINCLINKLSG